MMDVISKFDPGQIIGLVAVVGGLVFVTIVSIVGIVADHWHKMSQTTLKHDMLSRGMSADEICTVLEAGAHHKRKECRSHHHEARS